MATFCMMDEASASSITLEKKNNHSKHMNMTLGASLEGKKNIQIDCCFCLFVFQGKKKRAAP